MSDQRVWLTSDTHFRHNSIIRFCERPFTDTDQMDEYLIDMWNRFVQPGDIVYHLGDFIYGNRAKVKEYRSQLNGDVFIAVGNHDNENHLRDAFGNDRVFHAKEIRHMGHKIWLSHYPHRVWPSSHHGSFHAYGHSHGGLDTTHGRWGRSMDVGVDMHSYCPVSVEEFIDRLKDEKYSIHHPEE